MTKKILAISLCVILALALFGCGSMASKDEDAYGGVGQSSTAQSYPSVQEDHDGMAEEPSEGETGTDLNEDIDYTTPSDRKLIIRVEYQVQTKNFTETVSSILKQVSALEGYIAVSSVDTSESAATKYAYLELRIPTERLGAFTSYVEGVGNVLNKKQSGEDVTLQYFDYENRLESLEIQQDRVMALLARAERMEDILAIETELNRLRTEIESLTTTLRRLDNLVDYSTVTIGLYEVKTYEPVTDDSFGEKLATAFKKSIESAGKALENICYALVWLLPYLVVVAIIILVIILARRSKKKKRARLAAQWEQSQQQIAAAKNSENSGQK